MQCFTKIRQTWCLAVIIMASFLLFACGGGGEADNGGDGAVVTGDCSPAGTWTYSQTRTDISGSGTICGPALFPATGPDMTVQITVSGSQITITTPGSSDPPVTVNLDATCGAVIQVQTPDSIVTTANGVVTIRGSETITLKFNGTTVTGTEIVEVTSTPAIPELPCTGTYSVNGTKH